MKTTCERLRGIVWLCVAPTLCALSAGIFAYVQAPRRAALNGMSKPDQTLLGATTNPPNNSVAGGGETVTWRVDTTGTRAAMKKSGSASALIGGRQNILRADGITHDGIVKTGEEEEGRMEEAEQGDSVAEPLAMHPLSGTTAAVGTLIPAGMSTLGSITWNSVGPFEAETSGKFNAFAQDPTKPDIMYVGGGTGTGGEVPTSAGIYGTTDGGVTWKPLVNGLVDASGFIVSVVNDLWLDPAAPTHLVAATAAGIYSSADAGQNWTLTSSTTANTQMASVGNTLYATSSAGILASTDDGQTWTTSLAGGNLNTISSDAYPGHPGTTAYAGKSTANGQVYQLVGGTWVARGALPAASHRLAIDPFNTRIVYASAAGGGYSQTLYGSIDGGATWALISWKGGLGTQCVGFSTTTPHRVYIAGDGGTVQYTTGDGATNPAWSAGASPAGIDRRQFFLQPNADGTDDRAYITTDQGMSVTERLSVPGSASTGLTGSIRNFLSTGFAVTSDGQGLSVNRQDYSATATNDGGATWSLANSASEDGASAVNPADDSICYQYRNGFRRSSTGCGGWTVTDPALASSIWDPGIIAFDPADSNHLYTLSNGKVTGFFESFDGGNTFSATRWGFTKPFAIAVDPNSSRHIVASEAGGPTHVTFDGGVTWGDAAGLPARSFSVTIDPNDSKTLLALSNASNNITGGVYRSTDGGLTWTQNFAITGGFAAPRSIAFNPTPLDGDVPIAAIATSSGLFVTTDRGASWQRIDQNTISHIFTKVVWRQGYLYVGTYGQGILASTAQLQGSRPPNPPIANDAGATVGLNSGNNPVTLRITGGGATSVAVLTAPMHGTATASGTTITYTPSQGYIGNDSFTYTASNAGGISRPATVTIIVPAPGNVAPAGNWKFDEANGMVAADSSGNGYNGTLMGTPQPAWAQGLVGGALQFDGANNWVALGLGSSVSGSSDFTVAAWIKTAARRAGVIIQQRDSAYNGEYQFSMKGDGTLKLFVFGDGAYQFDFETAARVNDGSWHHVVATRRGTTGVIYIDGTAKATASGTVRNLLATIGTYVGRDVRDNTMTFNGLIDEVRVYSTYGFNASDAQVLYRRYLLMARISARRLHK